MKPKKQNKRLSNRTKNIPTSRKFRSNPKKPLDFYLKGRPGLENYVTYVNEKGKFNLTSDQILELQIAFRDDRYNIRLVQQELNYLGQIVPYYVGYITTRMGLQNKYILGIVELYKIQNKIEVHDFMNNIREIYIPPNRLTAENIFENLLQFYKRAIFEDLRLGEGKKLYEGRRN